MRVVNTQWMYNEPAVLLRESAKILTVSVKGQTKRFWRDSLLQLGHTKILRRGGEPSQLVLEN